MKMFALAALLMSSLNTLAFAETASTTTALFAYLKVQPGTEAQFMKAAQNVITESRKEPGNLVYILQESISDPQQFVIYEIFKSDADLEAHRVAKHTTDFLKEVNPILVTDGFNLVKYDHVQTGE